ncbi:MAG: methyltransferase, partial [Magnetospirillum sp.]|nr:methyltransferase [Magnetospirillum sp.]
GQVYAANTLGGILGVMLSLHVGLPYLGLEGLLLGAGAADVTVGLILLASLGLALRRLLAGTGVAAGVGLAGMTMAGPMDQNLLASGVYRLGALIGGDDGIKVAAQRHGKTASIHITVFPSGTTSIRTNGKSDAAVAPRGSQPQPDEATMLMVGALPLLLRPEARNVANIGFGSGLSTHALLQSPKLDRVDTIEIEPAMVDLAQHFRPANERAYTDPRSHIHFEDAKSFFAAGTTRWDVITSEPSNPWVSGVAGLFSREFYATAKRHLAPGGLLVQWMHLYEIDPALISTVFLALGESFPDYAVYASNGADILIAASPDGKVGEAQLAGFAAPALAADLARFGITEPDDIGLRRIGDRASLHALFAGYGLAANSDYQPVLDQGAAKSRFMQRSAEALIKLRSEPLPALEMLSGDPAMTPPARANPTPYYPVARVFHRARMIADQLAGRSLADDPWVREFSQEAAALVGSCSSWPRGGDRISAMLDVALATLAYLPANEAEALWKRVGELPCGTGLNWADAQWYQLFMAVARRDGAAMAASAEGLLPSATIPARRRYLTATAMLGYLATGNKDQAAA